MSELICQPKQRRFSTEFEKLIEQERCPSYVITDLTWTKKAHGYEASFKFFGRWRIASPANVTITGKSYPEMKKSIINFIKK